MIPFFRNIFNGLKPDSDAEERKLRLEDFLEDYPRINNSIKEFEIIQKNPYSYPHLQGNSKDYSKFIILGAPRTGSNHLVYLLKSHSSIVSFSELFNNERIGFDNLGYVNDSEQNINHRNSSPKSFLNDIVFRPYNKKIGAVGYKLFYEQAQEGKMKSVWFWHQNQKDLKIIHLQRRNLLESFISFKVAIASNYWAKIEPEFICKLYVTGMGGSYIDKMKEVDRNMKDKNITIEPNFNECLDYFINITEQIAKYKNFFKDHEILDVYYEDLLINEELTINKILDFLQVERLKLNSPLMKQNTRPIREIVPNYESLKKQFAGTEWEVFFIH